jgi:hypothetical protein
MKRILTVMGILAGVWFLWVVSSCKSGKPSQPSGPSPEVRVERALQSNSLASVRENLALIPDGTPGKDKVATHLKDLEAKSAQEEKAKQAQVAKNLAEARAALKSMKTEHDEVQDVTTYYHRDTTLAVDDKTEMVLAFTVSEKSRSSLHLLIKYVAHDWLFVESYTLKTDDGTITLTPAYGEVKRHNGAGFIWEWVDLWVDGTNDATRFAEAAVRSKTPPILRFNGSNFSQDHRVTDAERKRMGTVFKAFSALS